MNPKKYMIIIKDKIVTSEVQFCRYNTNTKMWDVKFSSREKIFPYAYINVKKLNDPEALNPNLYRISREGRELFDIQAIYVFRDTYNEYYHICFANGTERDYFRRDLEIVESCLNEPRAKNVFDYIKHIASLNDLKNEETGDRILAKRFEKIGFVGNNVALARYLNPSLMQQNNNKNNYIPIFPFGCNNSQYKAVKNAMENQISVIQGPPGTGKTQTILNIIANILMDGKTVQIVSNNNSATENVYEKLSSPKYNLGFIAATLGNSKNKKEFVDKQDTIYPDFSSWKFNGDSNTLLPKVKEKSVQLKNVFDMQEELAGLKQEQSQVETELAYFQQYAEEHGIDTNIIESKRKIPAKRWMKTLFQCQMISEKNQKIGFWFKIKGLFQYGISNVDFYRQDIAKIIAIYQTMYYCARKREIADRIAQIEAYIQNVDGGLLDDLCNQSMAILKDKLAMKYGGKEQRTAFDENDLWKNPSGVLAEYPVILSTTFSSRNSLNTNVVYDYLIMDEASQVDVATGALALSCARNVVIVGDTKQLPNVVTDDVRIRANAIFDSYNINEGYCYTKSFLQSVLDVIPKVSQTMLREHYRCHLRSLTSVIRSFTGAN